HSDNVIMLMFSEFGRRVRDNGSGTDHGAGGVAFVLGDKVKGGHYGEMPSMKPEHLVQGDLNPNMDFRSVYSTILDKWLKLNPAPIVNGTFEQPAAGDYRDRAFTNGRGGRNQKVDLRGRNQKQGDGWCLDAGAVRYEYLDIAKGCR
ncbi:MAG TPA: DUF1501 domain-containing protein, partial [Tepidisphaeraceae bacterium]